MIGTVRSEWQSYAATVSAVASSSAQAMRLSARDPRVLLVATVIVGAISTSLLQPMIRQAADSSHRINAAAEFYNRYQIVLAARAPYMARRDTAAVRLSSIVPRAFFRTDGADASLSQLLELLEGAAARNFVRLVRATPSPVSAAGPAVLRISATVECESDSAGILGLLRSLKSAKKLLHITDLTVSDARARAARASGLETLRFSFAVHGFVLSPPE